jgi:alkanesulfonate monooxygenase SsuD/methylene tetrahydromethanopterin reductase-like flavin-dependent oxidoreductase (luciferase family)
VKFGVGLPHEGGSEIGFVLEYARRAEEYGFDSVVMADHVFFENEALTTFAATAAQTRRVKIIPFVLDGNRRDPATLAHATATLDRLSGGRLVLGVGRGVWNDAYYGFEVKEPVARMEEVIRLLKRFWAGGEVTSSSRFFRFDKASSLVAKPLQNPHPPIWVAAFGERMLRIAISLGDGFITQNMPAQLLKKTITETKHRRSSTGGGSGFEAVYGAMPTAISENREEAWRLVQASARSFLVRHAARLFQEFGCEKSWGCPEDVPESAIEECFLFGTPSDLRRRIEEYQGAGADYLVFQQVLPVGFESLRMLSDVLQSFR